MTEILLDNQSDREFAEELFEDVCRVLSQEQKRLETASLNLILCDDGSIKEYNRKYRGKDSVTDVLSFSAEIPGINFLGDIIIDISVADNQKGNQSLEREVQFLFLHGLLHLLGYDHISIREKTVMEELQKKYWKLVREE